MTTTPQLPSLNEGRNSLVSLQSIPRTETPRDRASKWALDVRKSLEECLRSECEIIEDDVKKLKNELIAVFITALQQDSRPTWLYLQEVLELAEPFQTLLHYFDTRAEFTHYLERISSHFEIHRERLFDLQIIESLAKVFPEEMEIIKAKGNHLVKNYCVNPGLLKTASLSPRKSPRNRLPDGTNPYSTHVASDEEIMTRQSLTIRDLGKSIGPVAFEMAARESIWKHSLGTTALALNTDIPIPEEPQSSRNTSRRTSSIHTKLSPEKLKAIIAKSVKPSQEEVPVMTGREAVEYFAKCHHIGKIESIYFNLAPSRYYRPYDLISCPQNKANPEHYVFCTFGVLRVFPNQDNESLSLADWQKEAVLWKAVSSIPFFKYFLVSKSFKKWRANKLYIDFLRRKEMLSKSLLQAVPAFGAALMQVSRLLKELLLVNFLPFELDKTYQLGEYENVINYKNIQADKILERFFRFCRTVADVTAEESFKKLRYCDEQVKKKTLFSKDSMHLQRMKNEQREENLRKAKSETSKLGDFVKLMDMMIVEHMFDITKNQVIRFIHQVLCVGELAPRDGFFKANLVFTKHDTLTISPTKERFQKVLSQTLQGIPVVLCAQAKSMDGSVPDSEILDDAKSIDASQADSKFQASMSQLGSKKSASASYVSSMKPETALTVTTCDKASQKGEVTSRASSTKPTTSQSVDSYCGPELPKQVVPSKSDDDMGVATPDLVVKGGEETLVVSGEGFMGQYEPLVRANLQEKLLLDSEYQESLKIQGILLSAAFVEIDQYCQSNDWLNEISLFCHKWTDKSLKEFKGAAAFTIEQKLTELRMWSEKIRNFDQNFTTENGLFLIDCSTIHDGLLPRLNDIYQQLICFIAEEARTMSKAFCEEMKLVLKNMKDKKPVVSAFAVFAKNFSQYKKNTPQYQQRVEYIKSLFEVIRMGYRQLTPEEEKYEENVWAAWEAFLMQMQDASEFVNTQTPLMTQQLEDTYQRLEKEAYELSEKATSGIFLDPDQNASFILKQMKGIREKFFSIQLQLQNASKWREAICGEAYNLKFLNDMTARMDVRQELWKYVEVSNNAIKDWKQTLFKKMNIKKALEKVTEWIGAASQLKSHLPCGDLVLANWYTRLSNFKKDLPLLHKLSNDALKERHWKAIFLGMNEPYDPLQPLTVDDLLTCNLSEHADLIHRIYLSALAEYDLELNMNKITKLWDEMSFKLAKYIPDSVYAIDASNKRVASSTKRPTKLERFRKDKIAAASGNISGLDVVNDDLYLIIGVEELKYQLEDSRITVESMAQSSYLGDIKQQVNHWSDCLQQIEEITDLWHIAQKKWMYLLKIFEKAELYKKWPNEASRFEQVHNKLKDWMRVVSLDSKVMSVVNHRRGSKGYRLLQGDNLRSLFLSIIQEEEEILKNLESLFEEARTQFPRLFFLSNQDLIELLGISRNPQSLLPFVRKCFPGIQNLTFDLPEGTGGINSVLDFSLNSEKLQVVSMQGVMGEDVPLLARLEAYPLATRWLRGLENIMKNTLTVIMQACVQARMEEGSKLPIYILEELSHHKKPEAEVLKMGIKQTYQHWLLRFPVQCVITAEGIMWEKNMSRLFEEPEREDLKALRSKLCTKLEQYIEILKETTTNGNVASDMKERLHCLLYSLINQTVHNRDVMTGLLENSHLSETCFDWVKIMKYKMDIRNVLRAKTVEDANIASTNQRLSNKGSLRSIEDQPKISRARTTVSTDYQFSPCYIQQIGNILVYDYEYIGPSFSLTVTPLTERAYLSLSQSLKNFQCGTLIGPAGTGKSQTIRELAKILGRCLFTITCNESMTLPMMLQFITGMVQSGCWALFDDSDRLTTGLMSVAGQQLDYVRTALKTLESSNQSQYKIRGQPRFDKKVGAEEQVIRRNSLTTLHPLPRAESSPSLERQKTVPHGYNEKGLMTYFEDTWIAERERRRHSIEREIEIKESELYRANRPPPLFYEYVKKKRSQPDYSKLTQEPSYFHPRLGNVMFNGKFLSASANYGCFMTLTTDCPSSSYMPENFKLLMRPCALVVPDVQHVIEVTLCCYSYSQSQALSQKLSLFLRLLKTHLPRKDTYQFRLREIKKILKMAVSKVRDDRFLHEVSGESVDGEWRATLAEEDIGRAEEHSIVYALKEILTSSFENDEDLNIFKNLLKDIFPVTMSNQQNSMYQSHDPKMVSAIHAQLKDDHLEENDELVLKTLQLHSALELKSPVIITGDAGSGKSTVCRVLSQAINMLNYKLFAPDHSKDELTTDRDTVFAMKQKLQKDDEEEEILNDVEVEKKELTGVKKLRDLRQNISRAKDYIDSVQEQLKKTETPDHAEYPKIDIVKLTPTAMMPEELLGYFQNGLWQGGLLAKVVRDSYTIALATQSHINTYVNGEKKLKSSTDLPSVLSRWIVLDGEMDPLWTEGIKTVLDEEHRLATASGETITLKDSTSFIFETTSLEDASPSSISRCSVIHCSQSTVHWKSLFYHWKQTAQHRWVITSHCSNVLENLMDDVFEPTLKYLKTECTSGLLADLSPSAARKSQVVMGIQEVTAFFRIFNAMLDRVFLREDLERKMRLEALEEKEFSNKSSGSCPSRNMSSRLTTSSLIDSILPNYMDIVQAMFAFSFIWSFGGYLHDRCKDRFSKFAHEILYHARHPIRLPMWGQVFDYFVEETSGCFIRWSERQNEKVRSGSGGFVFTPEVERYQYLIDLMLAANHPVLLTGAPGVGKTALIQSSLANRHTSTSMRMSSAMTASLLQNKLLSRVLEMKNRGFNVGNAPGMSHSKQHHLFFIDDLNMASPTGSYHPPLELLRHILVQGDVYNKQRLELQSMTELSFIAACTYPTANGTGLGQASHLLSSRLSRLFVNLTIFCPSADSLLTIYSKPLHSWLEEFPTYSVEHHSEFAQAMVVGLLELYNLVRDKLKPTPAHAHYIFSLHDLAKVVQGVLLMSPRSRVRKNKHAKKTEQTNGKVKSLQSVGRQLSEESLGSRSRLTGTGSKEQGSAAPMMKVIAQLWCHECTRTFSDRLIAGDEKEWFAKVLEDVAVKQFCLSRDDPKLEMTAITEEPIGRSTPAHRFQSTPIISTPIDFDEVEKYMTDDDELDMVPEIVDASSELNKETENQDIVTQPSSGETASSEKSSPTFKADADIVAGTLEVGTQEENEIDTKAEKAAYETEASEDSDDDDEDSDSTDETTTGSPSDKGDSIRGRTNTPGVRFSQTSLSVSNPSSDSSQQTSDSKVSKDSSAKSNEAVTNPSSNISQQTSDSKFSQDSSVKSIEVTSATALQSKTVGPKRRASKTKRGVTFKAGLLADREHEAYYGPLMSAEELKGSSSSLTDFMFSKFYMTCHTENIGLPTEKGYLETNEESLLDALKTCLNVYNKRTYQQLDLIFFKESIRHAARLSRVLAFPGGNALLLGISYCTGRATLARLAAYTANCKIFEPKAVWEKERNLATVKEHIKRSCHHAGVIGKSTVLLIHEALGTDCLQLISSLMAEGKVPGLYSEAEINHIVSQMMPGGVQTKRVDKIEQALDRYVKRIRQNLHIIVCLNYKGNSFSSDFQSLRCKITQYPELTKHCFSMDLYKPWSFEDFTYIARGWLEDPYSKITIPWNISQQEEQITLASKAMAYVHMSSKAVIERQYCHQDEPLRFYTPLTFMEFVHIFKVITAFTVKVEKIKRKKYEAALCKIDEAFGSIAHYKKEVSCLAPKHKNSIETIHYLVEKVETQKQEYIQALEKCKSQEEKIAEIQSPLEQLKRTTQLEFDKVNPTYEAAQEVLKALNKGDIDEVKSYCRPPDAVKFVVKALCVLFNKPQEWEEGKLLLLKDNFIQEMIFYDKDNITPSTFKELQKYVHNPIFRVDVLKANSNAIASLCLWIHAIYRYTEIHRKMKPHLKSLSLAQDQFTKAQARLGQLRISANHIKSSLEREITAHKEAMKEAKAIEKKIQTVEKKIAKASNLMGNMSMQHFLWRSELKKARRHIRSAPGDALITAACVCYHGPLEDKFRSELLADWIDRCRQGRFDATVLHDRDPYSITSKLNILLENVSQDTESPARETTARETTAQETTESETNSSFTQHPQVKTFKYIPAVYDSRKYYKSELKRQDTMESVIPNIDVDDEEDEEELSPLCVRSGYTLQDILSDFDELSEWRMSNLPTDLHSVQNALLMRVSCFNRKHCWPLLIDPDNQTEMWVKIIQKSSNIFTERDVLDNPEDFVEGIPLPETMAGNESTDTSYHEPPPSRGTVLTFSDVTEYSINDTCTVVTETSRGMGSGESTNSDELRPVTSVTNSYENYSLRADSAIDYPEHNLWIIEADDPQLNSRLINAIVHGVTVLVTHLERKPLDSLFRGLLLKQFYVDKDGHRIVRVAGMEFRYHPDFCLYLSTTLPIFLKGDGLHHFPLHRLCIINMAISDEAIINRLLFETMKIERKEFEGQKRSNENDIILHRQMLAKEHEVIREKTLHLDIPLLDDRTMLDSLIACQNNVQKNRMILEETRYMGSHLEEKFAYYVPMMMKATMLYNVLKKMTVLHPCYYMPFYKYIEMFSEVIISRDRGKGAVGATPARAQELSDATTAAIFKYAAMMMFEEHYNLFALLVAIEQMLMIRKASNKETSLFINGFEKEGLDEDSLMDKKPDWMSKKVWVDVNILESLHQGFRGLCDSLRDFSTEWFEYFQLPITLVNSVPGITLQELTFFQKCLLWKFAQPQRLTELSKLMVMCELGSIVTPPDHYNITDVYRYTSQFTPTVFLLPSPLQQHSHLGISGHPYISPVHEVKRLAKAIGMEGKVRIINFGVESQLSEVQSAMVHSIENGYWLILQNYHLADQLKEEFLNLLKDIVYSKFVEEQKKNKRWDESEEGRSLVTRSHHSSEKNTLKIHPMFRLWFTSRIDGSRVLPGILMQHGLRVTCEMTINFKTTLQKSFRSSAFLLNSSRAISAAQTDERFRRIMPLALFHALLVHQSYYGDHAFNNYHNWDLADLSAAAEIFKPLYLKNCDPIKSSKMISQVYSDHCTTMTDRNVVEAIGAQLLKISLEGPENYQSEELNNPGVATLLQKLLKTNESTVTNKDKTNLQRSLDSLEDVSARTFCLSDLAEQCVIASKSRILCNDMVHVTGAPELFMKQNTLFSSHQNLETLIPQLLDILQDLPRLPLTSKDEINPMDIYFHYEVVGYKTLIKQMTAELNLILREVKGEIVVSKDLFDVKNSLSNDELPKSWVKDFCLSGMGLRVFVKELNLKMKMLKTYLDKLPPSVNLSVFLRPDRFMDVVLQHHARKYFKEVTDLKVDVQVMPSGYQASKAPKTGVFLTGLTIQNALWDTSRSILTENFPGNPDCQEMPLVWIKPINKSEHSIDVKNDVFICPLSCSCDQAMLRDENIIYHLPLPSLQSSQIWQQKHVFISSNLSNG
ncbi:hypothetical protein SNE40_023452 [Patella caerulea]|uniref:AAA+ ATPase domain-containing protein n=1 Tax=Patella caerulea TaxID=87958 RepID=A0AAN8G6G9_PATCE